LASGHQCGFVYGDILMVDNHGRTVRNWKTGVLKADRLEGRQIPHPAFFVRRELLNNIGLAFDPTLRIAADLKQQLILINKLGARGSYLPRALVKMRLGGTSTASLGSYVTGWKESARAYNDVFGRGGHLFTLLKVLSKLGGLRRLR
jgi:glycosyltransferase